MQAQSLHKHLLHHRIRFRTVLRQSFRNVNLRQGSSKAEGMHEVSAIHFMKIRNNLFGGVASVEFKIFDWPKLISTTIEFSQRISSLVWKV